MPVYPGAFHRCDYRLEAREALRESRFAEDFENEDRRQTERGPMKARAFSGLPYFREHQA
jgi:hypothetical protein